MARLGELLVAAGLLSTEQVEQALRAQVLWGGRLGTNLVELHHLELDPLAKALGRQHRLPAALARHFEKADPELQRMLSPEIAERFSCVPLLRMGPEGHVVVAALGPLQPRQLAVLAEALAVDVPRLVPAVAAELRIRYQLERVYRIRRAARFLRARGKSIPPFPAFRLPVHPETELDAGAPSLPISTREIAVYRPEDRAATEPGLPPPRADTEPSIGPALDAAVDAAIDAAIEPDHATLDDDVFPVEVISPHAHDTPLDPHPAVLEDDAGHDAPIDDASGRERRTYVRTIADAAVDADGATLGRIAIRKVAVGSAPRVMAGATLGEATRAIRRSTGRDKVADLVIDTLDRFAPDCDAAILLVIRGATAIGWKGFQRAGAGLGEIAVPMDEAGLVPRVAEHNVTLRCPAGELGAIDRLLLHSLGRGDGDLVVVPIAIAEQVMCVIAIATGENAPIACAEPIAAAAGAAFARLMRDASR